MRHGDPVVERQPYHSQTRRRPRAVVHSLRKIEPSLAITVFHLDNPNVGIKGDFPLKPTVRPVRTDPLFSVNPREDPFDARSNDARHGLRGRAKERRLAIQPINFHEDRAGFRSASSTQDRAHSLDPASAQVCSDPNIRAKAQPI